MSAVTFDAISTATAGNLPSFSHTCTGSNRLLLVEVTDWNVGPLAAYATGCTYNGVSMTVLDAYTTTPAGFRRFYLYAPASGSNTVTVTGSTGAAPMAIALSFANAHQSSIGSPVKANGNSTTATVNATGTSSESLVACLVAYFGGNTSVAAGAGQTNESKGSSGNTGISMSIKAGGGTVAMSETWVSVGSDSWAIGAVEILTATPTLTKSLATLGVG